MSKTIPNVSVKSCFGTIIVSLIAICVLLLPATFGSVGMRLSFQFMPLIGDGSITENNQLVAQGFSALSGLDTSLVAMILDYTTLAYMGILGVNIVFALLLAITRATTLRVFFKFYSILAGFAMLAIFLSSLIYIAGFAGLFIHAIMPFSDIMTALETSAILYALGRAILSAFLIKKQFIWFGKLY